jgi:cell division protease FtsH
VALGHKEELIFLGREIGEQKNYSEKVAEAIDEEIRRLIDEAYEKAVQIIKDKREILDTLASELVRLETIEGESLEAVFSGQIRRDAEPPSAPTERPTPLPSDLPGNVPSPPRLNPSPAPGT